MSEYLLNLATGTAVNTEVIGNNNFIHSFENTFQYFINHF